jgi:hypothetical protein
LLETTSTADRPPASRNRAVARSPFAGNVAAELRSKTTNRPLKGRVNRNTAKGRRIADVYHAYLAALGDPTDAIVQANVLTAAELKIAAEEARKRLLDGAGDADALVRLENLAHRAESKLGIKRQPAKPRNPLAEHFSRPPVREASV